jgi:hypothetical protein
MPIPFCKKCVSDKSEKLGHRFGYFISHNSFPYIPVW